MVRRDRRWLWVLIAITIVGVVTVGALGLGGAQPARTSAQLPPGFATVQVTKGTLTNFVTIDGTLNHGPEVPISLKATGTVTWLPPLGTTISRGQALLRIDDRPVVLLYGDLPMYRGLAQPADPAAPAFKGNDVLQFKSNLKELGYKGFAVDDAYTAQTTAAIKRWQKDLGVPETGAVGVADVVYVRGPIRVAHAVTSVGGAASGNVLAYTNTDRVVTVNAPANNASWAVAGVAVSVILPDERVIAGRVASVATDISAPATLGQAGGSAQPPTIAITIAISDQSALGALDSSPVQVRYVVTEHKDVLSVPVSALVALAEGGYGLEVVENASSHFVAVQTGLFADGRVEVTGSAIHVGMTVRVPQ